MHHSPPLPKRQRLFHTSPPWVKSGETFFISLCCTPRHVNQLARPEKFQAMTAALEHYIGSGKLWANLFLAMPDHLHVLLSFPPSEDMSMVMRNWKRFVAKQAGITWQSGFFDHRLRRGKSYLEKAHYIRMNPVRAGLVKDSQDWPYVWEARGA